MPTPAQIRAAVDAKMDLLRATVVSREDTYAAAHNGRYWQGLRTHTLTPADGIETLPDIGLRTPTDQPTVWPVGIRTTAIPMALQIDVYDGPFGVGYQGTLTVTIVGQDWQRCEVFGPETWRAFGWRQVV